MEHKIKKRPTKAQHKLLSRKTVLLRIFLSIALAEIISMYLIYQLPVRLGHLSESLLDATLLCIISSPIIYLWVIIPFSSERDAALYRLKSLAFTDALTGLSNRRYFSERIEDFLEDRNSKRRDAALLLIDLDGFKQINDKYGHRTGDVVLREISKRLKENTSKDDILSRIGGDEFAILLTDVPKNREIAHEHLEQYAAGLIAALQKPINYRNRILTISASVGIRILGYEAMTAKVALHQADIPLYASKNSGGGRASIFTEPMISSLSNYYADSTISRAHQDLHTIQGQPL